MATFDDLWGATPETPAAPAAGAFDQLWDTVATEEPEAPTVSTGGLPPIEDFVPPVDTGAVPEQPIQEAPPAKESRLRVVPSRNVAEPPTVETAPAPDIDALEGLGKGAAVGAARVASSKLTVLGALMRNIPERETFSADNEEHVKAATLGRSLAQEFDLMSSKRRTSLRDPLPLVDGKPDPRDARALAEADEYFAGLTSEEKQAIRFYKRHKASAEGTKFDRWLDKQDAKFFNMLRDRGADKALELGRAITNAVPEEWAEQVARESGKDLSPKRLLSDPGGWATSALSALGQQVPIFADQIISSTVGGLAGGGFGAVLGGAGSMIGLEAAGFIEGADQYKQQLPPEQQ